MDKIFIENLEIYAYHGVNEEEKEKGQPFVLNIEMRVNINKACRSDDVGDTVSYSAVAKTVTRAFTAEKYNLLERAAEAVADTVLGEYPDVFSIRVNVKKTAPPMKAKLSAVGVEIERNRS